MLTKCIICGFNVRKNDEYCLNCGKKEPTVNVSRSGLNNPFYYKIFQSDIFWLFLSLIVTFIVLYFVAGGNLESFFYLREYIWLGAIILWSVLFFSFYKILKKKIFFNKKTVIIKSKNNLISISKIVEKRVFELNSRLQEIDFLLSKMNETDSRNLQEVRRKLLAAREIIVSQFARYELQKQKIELVRLQNGVLPYLFSVHRLNEFETENGLVTIENTRHEINKIRTDLMRYDAIEFPQKTLPTKENFLSQLAETENSCKSLREVLLSKQATRALQGISPIEEKLKLPHTNELAHTAETFNLQTTLTDFSESFEELEREYRRVQSESEISQKILTDET